MIFEMYWQHFVLGVGLYLVVRWCYFVYNEKKNKAPKSEDIIVSKSVGKEQLNEEIQEILDEDDNSTSENENANETLMPALDKDLKHIPLQFNKLSIEESLRRSEEFYWLMNKRRTVRHFSTEDVPIEVVRNIVRTAGTAPSGAHTEPWTFIVVGDSDVKQKIREIIEEEEEINYKKRMGVVWTTDLKPLKTNWIKEYLTDAPYLILVFKQIYSYKEDCSKKLHYYNEQSVSLATGLLLAAIQNAGLASLISTPLNCGPALRTLLRRPNYEKLSLLLPVGYPAEDCLVPDLHRKRLEDIMIEV